MSRTLNPQKFLNGTLTPQEFVAVNTFGMNKCRCGNTPVVCATVFMPYVEACKRGYIPPGSELSPEIASVLIALRTGCNKEEEPHVRMSQAYSCRVCQPAFERALAKSPSWAVIDINRGPDPSNRVVVGV
jgi:hypothetical protein